MKLLQLELKIKHLLVIPHIEIKIKIFYYKCLIKLLQDQLLLDHPNK